MSRLTEYDQKRIRAQFFWEHTTKPIQEICRESGISNANTIRGWAHQLGWKSRLEGRSRDRAGKLVKLPSVAPDAKKQDPTKMDSKPNRKLNEALERWNRDNASVLRSLAEGQ